MVRQSLNLGLYGATASPRGRIVHQGDDALVLQVVYIIYMYARARGAYFGEASFAIDIVAHVGTLNTFLREILLSAFAVAALRFAEEAIARGENRHLDLFAQAAVGRHTPFGFDVLLEAFHELVYLVHFLHNERMLLLVGEGEAENNFAGIIDIVAVEQRRMERVGDGFRDTLFAFAVAR